MVHAVMSHHLWRGVRTTWVESESHPVHVWSHCAPQMVHALSPKASKSPALDISQPVAISVPAKVGGVVGVHAVVNSHGNHS